MRPARMLLGTALALAVAWTARAEPAPSQAAVLTDGAEVRGKPGTDPAVYVTQKLPRGTAVQVVERLPNGWLKIEPPLPGSYSWVNTHSLRPLDNERGVWVVSAAEPVPTLVGSWGHAERPNVVGTTLARGAQVIAVGGRLHQDDGDWLPILPPPGEYRYVLEKDVSPPPGASSPPTTTVAHPGTPPAGSQAGGLPALSPVAAASPPASSLEVHVGGPAPAADPLIQQAKQLEDAGDRLGAARLYDQLGNKYSATDHAAAVQYYTHAGWLRGGPPLAVGPAPVNEADGVYQRARQAEQAGNWPEAARGYIRLGDMFRDSDYKLSLEYYNHANWLKQKGPAAPATPTIPPATAPQSAVTQARAISLQEIGPGRIVRSPTPIDNRATYVLESAQATALAYLTPQPGVDLERYVGQNARVLGESALRADLRVPYMKVARVVPLASP
ncbi:MAG TPA: SH3 domain-containing protein [Gemmataceae bacterium]|nr:SH3 domain-containing protein [Gemmataceae bacterium]